MNPGIAPEARASRCFCPIRAIGTRAVSSCLARIQPTNVREAPDDQDAEIQAPSVTKRIRSCKDVRESMSTEETWTLKSKRTRSMPRGSRRGGRRSLEIDSLEGRTSPEPVRLADVLPPPSERKAGRSWSRSFRLRCRPSNISGCWCKVRSPRAPGSTAAARGGEFPLGYRSSSEYGRALMLTGLFCRRRWFLDDHRARAGRRGRNSVLEGLAFPARRVRGLAITVRRWISSDGRPGSGFASRFAGPGTVLAGRPAVRHGASCLPRPRITHTGSGRPRSGPGSSTAPTIRPVPPPRVPRKGSRRWRRPRPSLHACPCSSQSAGDERPREHCDRAWDSACSVSLVSLPLVHPGPGGQEPAASTTPVTVVPAVKLVYLSAAAPLAPPEPGTPVDPSPQGADLITRFSPFELTPIEESFSRLVERIVSVDGDQEPETNDVTPVLLIVAGLAAIEASRRWRARRQDDGSGRSWVVRRSAMHHPI